MQLEKFSKLENKIFLYKKIPPVHLDKLPIWKFYEIVDDWLDDIDKQQEEQDRVEQEYKTPSTEDFKMPSLPSGFPKIPGA